MSAYGIQHSQNQNSTITEAKVAHAGVDLAAVSIRRRKKITSNFELCGDTR